VRHFESQQRSTFNVQRSTLNVQITLAFWSALTCPRFKRGDMPPQSKIQLNGTQLPD
jgi:hypothetical protein